MNIKNKIFAALLICIAGTSCLKEKLETKYNQQEASIDGYIANNPTATRKANTPPCPRTPTSRNWPPMLTAKHGK